MKKDITKTTLRATGRRGTGRAAEAPTAARKGAGGQGQRDGAATALPVPSRASTGGGDVEAMLAEFRAVVRQLADSYQRGGMTPDAAKAKAFEHGFESALTGWADCIRLSHERDRLMDGYVKSSDKLREAWARREELHARASAAEDKLLAIAETERDEARRALAQLKKGEKRKRRNGMYQQGAIDEFWSRETEWKGKNRGMQRTVAEQVMEKWGIPVEGKGKGRRDLVPNFIRAAQDRRRD